MALHTETGVPALSAAICSDRDTLWAGAYGAVDVELGVAATPAHAFRLGSVSKPLTASLAARLAQQGRLDLNAPIGAYGPELPAHHRATTLMQLLTHRGGVRHYAAADFNSRAPGGLPDLRPYRSNEEILALFIDDPLIAEPGNSVTYSTYGYTLASIILERATEQSFLQLLQTEIADPLGLVSLHADDPFVITPNRANGYATQSEARRLSPRVEGPLGNAVANPAYKWAGGGLVMSPSDLARFGAAHLREGHWSRAALDLLFTPQTEATSQLPPMGLGWRVDRDESGRLRWHHAGTQTGCRAVLVIYPEQRLSIAFATNLTATPDDVLTPAARFADAALA